MPILQPEEDYGDVTPITPLQKRMSTQQVLLERQRLATQAQAQVEAKQAEQQQATQRMQQKVFQTEEQMGFKITAPQEYLDPQSVKFYTELGYPEYAGKYQPFTVPEGYKVSGIKETPSGLEIAFVPSFYKEEPKGIAETLAGIEVKPLISYFGFQIPPQTPIEFVKPRETVRPFAGVAGVIAPFESITYVIPRLVGIETPRPPPTLISLAPGRAMEYGPEYAAGTLAGDILLSMGFGKVAGKIWEYTPKIIKAPITKVAETVAKPFRPITEPVVSKLEEWTLWPHERLAPGIVSIPTPERVGLKGLEAQLTGWELAEAPKTSAYLISKMPAEPLAKAWATEHLFKTATGGLSYALVREQLRTTAPPTMPYIPKTEAIGLTSKGLSQALGVGIAVLPKALQPKVAKPKLETVPKLKPQVFEEPYEIQKLKLFPQAYPRQKEKQIAMLTPKLMTQQVQDIMQIATPLEAEALAPIQKQAQAQAQALVQAQQLIQKSAMFTPSISANLFNYRYPDDFMLRRRKYKATVPMFGFYTRYRYQNPIATAKQVLRTFL